MVIPYIIVSIVFYILSALLVINPGWIKYILLKMVEKKLVMIYGILEIVTSLIILYFRKGAQYPLIPIIIGLLLFIDGIMYVVLSNQKNRLIYLLLQMQKGTVRKLSFVTLFAALALSFSGLPAYF